MKKRNLMSVMLLVALLFTCVSCGAKDGYAMEDSYVTNGKAESGDFFYGAATDMEYDYTLEAETEYVESKNPTEDTAGSNDLAARKIIKNASLSFETLTYDAFVQELEHSIASMGGYVQSSEGYGGGIHSTRQRYVYITARIPEANYNRFMTEVSNMGTLTQKSENANDVTMSYVDTQSRIKSLQAEYDALLAILEKATSLDDVILLQSRISEVTYQLESYQSQLRKYDDLISYCTVRISVNEVKEVTQNVEVMTLGERIEKAFANTLDDITESFEDFTVWFVSSIPYILMWAVVILVIVSVCRSAVKKSKKRKAKKQENETQE